MDLTRRVVSTTVLGSIALFLLVFAFHPILRYVVVAFCALLAGIAVWEYEQFVKAKGGRLITPALIIFSALEVIAFFFFAMYPEFKGAPVAVFFVGFLTLFAMHFGQKEGAIVNLAVSSFGFFYIAIPIGMIVGILYLPDVDGRWWIAYLLVVTKITDVGAYFAGSLWGKHKLAPHISPQKTVEGALFGLLCAVAASFLFFQIGGYLKLFDHYQFAWLILGVILGVLGQFGDLSESLLKRDAQKKDSNALPGLGGVLDLLDSIIFNSIIVFIYLYYIHL